jgi:hypothetical protein
LEAKEEREINVYFPKNFEGGKLPISDIQETCKHRVQHIPSCWKKTIEFECGWNSVLFYSSDLTA